MLRDKNFLKIIFLGEIFASDVLHIQRPPLVSELRMSAPHKSNCYVEKNGITGWSMVDP